MSKVCINIAWPYSNGTIHLGHLAGSLLPPDIFSRYNRLLGNEVLMVGGSDQHGTPITVSAEKCGMTPEAYADKFHEINKKAIEDMEIEYSLFNKTHCDTHFKVTQDIFLDLKSKGYIYTKETNQYYCPKCSRFLPDRYVEGVCPKCGAEKTRSDQCDACGTTFEPGDLLKPYCTLCNSTPEIRPTEHFFLKLSAFRDDLIKFVSEKDYWRSNVKAFTKNWLEDGLYDRAITRDMAWGVPIPIEGWEDKVIYVWFEAVIGYLSASVEYSKKIGKPDYWKEFWMDPEVRHYYFIGKDNIPFHSIIWPAILMGIGNMDLPYDIPANEYLMIGGGKFSKSRGGAIDVPSVLQKYDADVVRFYLSAIMPDTHDSEFSWDDFQTKVNNELVANLGNYYHRCLSFTKKNFGTIPEAASGSQEVTDAIAKALEDYNACLSTCDFKKGIKVVMDLAHFGNRYFDSVKPWALVKSDKDQCGAVMNDNLRIVKALSIMAWPFMPKSSETIWGYLGFDGTPETVGLSAATEPLPAGQELREPIPVYKKVEIEMEDDKKEQKQQQEKKDKPKEQPQAAPAGPFAMFRRMDLRVGTVVEVSDHPDAEKLFVLKVDCGEGEPRQLVTNLKWRYTAEEMMGRRLIVISNLKPAKFRGVQSMGMLTAADDENMGGDTVHLLAPSCDIPNGTRLDCGVEGTSSRIETKHVEQVVMKTVHVVDGKAMGVDMPADAPKVVIAVIDGDDVMILGDGKGCYATIDGDIQDGANVL